MTDWHTLQPLRSHSRFMTVVVLILAGILFFAPGRSSETQTKSATTESNTLQGKVKAVGGLSIREQPNVHSAVLISAPNKAGLTIINDNAAEDIIGGRSGSWYEVEYKGIKGYAWGKYIER